jgi:hypothetical protein
MIKVQKMLCLEFLLLDYEGYPCKAVNVNPGMSLLTELSANYVKYLDISGYSENGRHSYL